jgi:hypothetical protein
MTRDNARKAPAAPLVALIVALLSIQGVPVADAQPVYPDPQSKAPLLLPAVSYDSAGYFPRSVAVGDVNGDGAQDLLVANSCGIGNCASGSMSVLLGNGDGSLRMIGAYDSAGSIAASVAIADLNGDGKPDFVVANCGPIGINTCGVGNGVLRVSLGNGDGTFQPVLTLDSGGIAARSITAADVNGDGSLDLLVANMCGTSTTCIPGSVGVLLGRGNATFDRATPYDTTYDINWISAADVNGDGTLDLLVTSGGNNRVGVLPGNGDGTFQEITTYAPGGLGANGVAAADASGDGTPDLMVANHCDDGCTSGSLGVLLGTGNGGFQAAARYGSGGNGAGSIVAADVNGDGTPDVLVANSLSNTAGLLVGRGDGTFQPARTYGSGGEHPTFLSVADLNGDSAPDLAVANACVSEANCTNGLVGVLLSSADTAPPMIAVSTTSDILRPPNGTLARVTVFGSITDLGSGVNAGTVTYLVTDEYGEIQPGGPVSLEPDGGFSFTVLLPAARRGTDRDGRHYTVTLSAADNAGNLASGAGLVAVPHDRRN